MTEYPEDPGYLNEPGFVKSNPLNNESYLAQCCECMPRWANLLRETHQKLVEIDPGYNIKQIKVKFGGLRYYWDCSPEWREDGAGVILSEFTEAYNKMCEIAFDAEEKAYAL